MGILEALEGWTSYVITHPGYRWPALFLMMGLTFFLLRRNANTLVTGFCVALSALAIIAYLLD